MKLRQHRGSLADSMDTVVEIPATLDALVEHIRQEFSIFPDMEGRVTVETVHVHKSVFDERIGWDTHTVTVDGYGVYGMTDGPVSVSFDNHAQISHSKHQCPNRHEGIDTPLELIETQPGIFRCGRCGFAKEVDSDGGIYCSVGLRRDQSEYPDAPNDIFKIDYGNERIVTSNSPTSAHLVDYPALL